MILFPVAATFIFVIGAVLGTVLRFKVFLRASLLVGALIAILPILGRRGLYSILVMLGMAVMFVILMLVGAAIGRVLKQAFVDG
jgi:hypothetical protein